MAVLENGFPFDNVEYDATALGAWLSTRTRGVFSADDHYTVTPAEGMQVSVSPGIAWLKMNEQWGMVAPNPATITLDVDAGDTILNRIDVVCLRIDKNQSVQEVVIKKGSLAASPVYPALVRDLNYDEVFLAAISVPAGTTELTAALLTDLRLNEEYCGLMRDGVTGIPTAVLQEQAEALIAQLQIAIDGVIDGSQYMLKTQYAPDAAAVISEGMLVITSENAHVGGEYDVRFEVPDGYEAGMPIVIDGVAVDVVGADGDESSFEAAPGTPGWLIRRDDKAYTVGSGGGGGGKMNIIVVGGATQPDPQDYDEGAVVVWVPSAIENPQWSSSPQRPTPAEANHVYLPYDRSSPVIAKALSNQEQFVMPIGMPQVASSGGAWQLDTASQAHVNGVWVPFRLPIAFEDGTNYTGGEWAVTFSDHNTSPLAEASIQSPYLYLNYTGVFNQGDRVSQAVFGSPVDLTAVSTISAIIYTQGNRAFGGIIALRAEHLNTSGYAAISNSVPAGTGSAIVSVESLSGLYYIGLRAYTPHISSSGTHPGWVRTTKLTLNA